MITDSYDILTEPIGKPTDFFGETKFVTDTCIVTFSREIYKHLIETYNAHIITSIKSANGITDIYLMEYKGKKIAFYLTGIGSMLASTFVIETSHIIGAKKFVMFGSAGSLDSEKTKNKYVLPTYAYRDEGMSYHYAPPQDYIKVKNAEKMEELFKKMGLNYVMGRVWTTDAFYRETRGLMAKRKEEGCIAVEMEIAGVQSVCDFYGLELYTFVVTGDVLDQPEYDKTGLHDANHSLDKVKIALDIASAL